LCEYYEYLIRVVAVRRILAGMQRLILICFEVVVFASDNIASTNEVLSHTSVHINTVYKAASEVQPCQ